jgi:hypothetical protein
MNDNDFYSTYRVLREIKSNDLLSKDDVYKSTNNNNKMIKLKALIVVAVVLFGTICFVPKSNPVKKSKEISKFSLSEKLHERYDC